MNYTIWESYKTAITEVYIAMGNKTYNLMT